MTTQKAGESIPDIYIKIPSEVEDENTKSKYNLQYAIRLGIFNYAYHGIDDRTKKEILIKYISTNSMVIANVLMNTPIIKMESSNFLLNFISTGMCTSYKIPFLVVEGGWSNLSELVNWNGSKLFNPDTFLIPAIDAINFLSSKNIIHGYLKTSSFWYKQNGLCKDNPNCRLKCIERIVLSDYEKCCFSNNNFEDNPTLKNAANTYPELSNISKQRGEGAACNLKYCAAINHTSRSRCQSNDYESIFYILVELYEHTLPWEHLHNDENIIKQKKETLRSPECQFFYNIPEDLAEIVCIIDKYTYLKDHSDSLYNVIHKKYSVYKEKYTSNNYNTSNDTEYIRIARVYRANNNIPTIFNKTNIQYIFNGDSCESKKEGNNMASPMHHKNERPSNKGGRVTPKSHDKRVTLKENKKSNENNGKKNNGKVIKHSSEKNVQKKKTIEHKDNGKVVDSKKVKPKKKLFGKIFKPKTPVKRSS
uniref:Protein kinase domain-containing protein n=1 Tax=Strongyloides stercoralis TaxID=6248 RepID=A0A0K0E6L0_STRER